MAQAELRGWTEVLGGEVAGEQLRPCRGGDHGGIVSGESERGKGDGQAAPVGFGLETAT
jgi:hypothetical protein